MLLAIYLFGTQSQGTQNAASDVDLAILMDGRMDPFQLWQVAQSLAVQINTDVDLIDLSAASTIMQYQIITTDKRLWQKDAQAAIYESGILTDKMDLDAARTGVLAY